MGNSWDKRDDESKAAHAALMDYLRMGTKRSLRSLVKRYESQTSSKPPTTKLNSLTTWSNKHEWVKRADAYDDAQEAKQDKRIAAARSKLITDEMKDYRAELARFRSVRSTLNFTGQDLTEETIEFDESTGITTVTRTVVESINPSAHRTMSKWRGEISALGRRSLGMPEKITERHIDPDMDAEKMIKGYIGISPDDWDDGDEADSAV